MNRKVLFLDTVHPFLKESLEKLGYECIENYTCDLSEAQKLVGDCFGMVIRSRFVIDQEFLDASSSLKFIARSGSGMENINVEYAKSMGISCFNSPEGNRDAVGEHAIGMLLSLLNNLNRGDAEVRKGLWKREENRGSEIGNKCIGIIGYGNTGSAFAEKLKGFGCQVLAHDKIKKDFSTGHVQECTLDDLLKRSDVVSLHIPFNEENRYYANDKFFSSFEKDIYFINTSRGGVLETSALVGAMKSGKVKGACLDVLEYEKSSFSNLELNEMPEEFQYLASSEKTILSPHVAGWTHESYLKLSTFLFEKIRSEFHS